MMVEEHTGGLRNHAPASDARRHSRVVVDGLWRAPARAMLRAVGFTDEDFAKTQVGVGTSWNTATPCNMHLDALGSIAVDGVHAGGGVAVSFGTIAVSDGIAMGHRGMRASLVSREVIADSVEIMTLAEGFDALVLVAGCDKSLPGMAMAAARLDVPAVIVYGGTILPGRYRNQDVTVQNVFEAVGAVADGKMSEEELADLERAACPGPGSCAGMYTANTMACAFEAIGLSLPASASAPAVSQTRRDLAAASGQQVVRMAVSGLTARKIITRASLENAIAVVAALGGSTNAVLHLLAIAHEAGVRLELDDFDRISRRTPHLADLRPGGRFVMADLDRIGGLPVLMRGLLDAGLLHGDAVAANGRTLAENLEPVSTAAHQDVIRPASSPLNPTGGLAILRGTLAPEGAVLKAAAAERGFHRGPACVFESEEACAAAVTSGRIRDGDVVVIRNEGPSGGPGMREMLSVTAAITGRGLEQRVALVTDGRFSGATRGTAHGSVDSLPVRMRPRWKERHHAQSISAGVPA